MKKTISAILMLSFTSLFSFSQTEKCFEKGSKVAEGGIGIAIYRSTFTDKSITPNTTNKDTSGAVLFPFSFEYGILNWLGAGAKFNYNNYIEGDSANNQTANGVDFSLLVRLHALRTKRIDLYAGVEWGYSHFAYKTNDGSGGIAKAGGTTFSFNLNSRFYFGERWGMKLFYNFDSYNYPNGTIENNSVATPYDFSLKQKSAFLIGTGLMFKF